MKNELNNNCNCHVVAEWHPEENVYMPDYITCESCKCKQADELYLNQIQGVKNV